MNYLITATCTSSALFGHRVELGARPRPPIALLCLASTDCQRSQKLSNSNESVITVVPVTVPPITVVEKAWQCPGREKQKKRYTFEMELACTPKRPSWRRGERPNNSALAAGSWLAPHLPLVVATVWVECWRGDRALSKWSRVWLYLSFSLNLLHQPQQQLSTMVKARVKEQPIGE